MVRLLKDGSIFWHVLSKKEFKDIWVKSGCDKVVHPFCPESCLKAASLVWKDCFFFASGVYIPLFVIPAIAFNSKKKPLLEILRKTVPPSLNSSAFLATLASSVLPISCALRSAFGYFSPILVAFGGTIGALSILMEKKQRRTELALFTVNQSIEAVYKMFVNRGILPIVPLGDVLVFVFAIANLSYFYNHESSNLGSIRGLIQFLIGDKGDQEPHKPRTLCTHTESCFMSTCKGWIRGLLIGCGLRGCLTFLSLLIIRRMYRKPTRLLELSFGRKTLDFGLFLSFFVGLWKGVACFLRNIRVREDGYNAVIAGGIAGLSIMFSRSTEISMYCLSKALEAIFHSLVARGKLKKIPQGEVLVFAIGTSIIFYCCALEPYNLRPSYWRFMRKVSGGRFDQFEMIARVHHSLGFIRSGFQYPNGTPIGK